jgi:prevent-host-death family protein
MSDICLTNVLRFFRTSTAYKDGAGQMALVGIRDLNRDTKGVIETLEETREPVILTRRGKPIAAIMPLDQRGINDLVISTAPEFVDSRRRAEQQFEAGETRSLDDAMGQIRARRAAPAYEAAQATAQAPDRLSTASAVAATAHSATGASVDGVLMGSVAGSYRAFVHEALTAQARRLSQAIVGHAIEHGLLSREGEGTAPLEAIDEANTRLYEIALAAEGFRAIEATMEEAADSGGEPPEADPVSREESPELEPIGDLGALASGHVWSINCRLLSRGKARGGISLTEYADSLRVTSAAGDAAAESIALEPLPTVKG